LAGEGQTGGGLTLAAKETAGYAVVLFIQLNIYTEKVLKSYCNQSICAQPSYVEGTY